MIRQLAALSLLIVACKDNTGPALPSVADLAGRWNLVRLEVVGIANPSQKLDLKAQFGISATLVIAADGQAVLSASVQGSDVLDTATITLHRDTLVYSVGGGLTYAYIVATSRSSMTWTAVVTDNSFDLNGDGSADESREVDSWQRF
jgi:hypothetical protein